MTFLCFLVSFFMLLFPTKYLCVCQELARQSRVNNLYINRVSFDTPAHDLSRRPQPAADLVTIYRILRQTVEDGLCKVTLGNFLLDKLQIERTALVQVRLHKATIM